VGRRIWSWSVARRSLLTGDPRALDGAERVAIVASFHPAGIVTRSLATLVGELRSAGYRVVLSRSVAETGTFRWPDEAPGPDLILERPNLGYDFGSWAAVLQRFPDLLRRPRLLFVNDSLAGPFAPIADLLADFDVRDCDVWGSVMNPQFFPHVQSFFFGYRDGIGADPAIRRWWRRVRHHDDKDKIVQKYELGMNRLYRDEAYVIDAYVGVGSTGYGIINPTLMQWRQLMQSGFPFVKRALLTTSEATIAEIEREVEKRYGTELGTWVA
jgi:lipopolysaccharide biosynthesis protein